MIRRSLAGVLVQVHIYEVLVEHLLHQAAVLFRIPDNHKGDIRAGRADAPKNRIPTGGWFDYQFRLLHFFSAPARDFKAQRCRF